jgi:hypothetical protein
MNWLCRLFTIAAVVAALLFDWSVARAAGGTPALAPLSLPLTADNLSHNDQAALEGLYRHTVPGAMPSGYYAGRALPSPGSRRGARQSKLIGLLWKGKEFPAEGVMVNHLAFDVSAIRSHVYIGESWLDGGPAIILDYSSTSRLFSKVRDEVREVSPGFFLGVMYVRKSSGPKRVMFFTLQGSPVSLAESKDLQ